MMCTGVPFPFMSRWMVQPGVVFPFMSRWMVQPGVAFALLGLAVYLYMEMHFNLLDRSFPIKFLITLHVNSAAASLNPTSFYLGLMLDRSTLHSLVAGSFARR
uniref:Uncharacterized protein n=1 Tax=Picea sitchensis TaxID=3332 RepID=D5A8F4_PICSI|nr:unknown [Picea sitchensis]